jgi:uncharacterized membrane protein
VKKSLLAQWQANFLAGLAIVFPAVLSIGAVAWLFGTVANITDTLLIFIPHRITHKGQGVGEMYWYWSFVALLFAIVLITAVGMLARNYFGKRLIEWVDSGLLRVPLLNKIYSATKQVNDAFSSSNKTSFRTVVLVEYPHPGSYSMGFLTSDGQREIEARLGSKMVSVFVPTTPNPTGGFLLFFPAGKVLKLDMSVADGIKYIISLGSISPEHPIKPPGNIEDAKPLVVSP